jgi:uncharacterized paraquat-inducible protein A
MTIKQCECGYQTSLHQLDYEKTSVCPRCERPIILVFADANERLEYERETALAFTAGTV